MHDDDPDFVEVYRQSYRQQLRYIYDGLESDRDLEGREMPALAAEEARMSAGFGIDLGPFLLGYRVTHRLILEDAMDTATQRIADNDLHAEVLRVTSRWLFAYIDWMTARVSEVYERERDLVRSDRQRRSASSFAISSQASRLMPVCCATTSTAVTWVWLRGATSPSAPWSAFVTRPVGSC